MKKSHGEPSYSSPEPTPSRLLEDNLEKTIQDLRQTNHRYHSLIHSSPQLIAILLGEDMIISVANEAIMETWGKGRDIYGKSLFEIMPEIVEQGFGMYLQQVYRTGIPFHANEMPVYLIRHGKKELMHYTFIYQAQRDAKGNIEGVAIIATEVTPQVELNRKIKESEANFRQLAEFMSEKFASTDSEGKPVYLNKNWSNYTGLTAQELVEEGFWRFIHPDDFDMASQGWLHSRKTGAPFYTEFRLRSKDDTYQWHLCHATPARDSDGKITKWIILTTEIQSQKDQHEQLEKAVRERTRELEKAKDLLQEKNVALRKMNQELESFAYISSHDLREPLRKIQTFASRILEGEYDALSEKGRHAFDRINESARHMQTLIEDLLSYSRVSIAGNQFIKSNLNTLFEEVRSSLREAIAERGATVEESGLSEAWVIPFQFRQMMQNLITNSLKFCVPDRAPQIRITCLSGEGREFGIRDLDPKERYLHISVSDNGIGFEPQYTGKIFEVFQRLHQKAAYSGTGIGLAIVKKIVENHHGFITAKGIPNQGATFDIYLPEEISRTFSTQTVPG